MNIDELLTSEVFDKAYEEYKAECEGTALHAPDTNFGPDGIEGKFKNAARWLCKKMLDEEIKIIRQISGTTDFKNENS